MHFLYETNRLYLKVLNSDSTNMVLKFLYDNRQAFEPFETKKCSSFYTMKYQSDVLCAEFNAFLELKYIRYYIFTKDNPNEIIGTVSFTNILPEPYCSCSIGYKIAVKHQRMGYAKEAITSATNAMFRDFGIHRIEAFVMHNNTASMNLLDSLNFSNEGLCKKNIKICGNYEDHYRFSIISPYL